MRILGIDTSCDDTCIAILEIKNSKFEILSNVVSSQAKLHAKYGGVYPFLAKREHQKNLPIVFKKALKEAGLAISNFQGAKPLVGRADGGWRPISKQIPNSKFQILNVDFITVTVGPGLEPCLWQGVNFAREIAKKYKKSLIPVNHIEAHIVANFISSNFQKLLPAICLVVSGGHTQLILMKEIGKYKLIGETRDDAAGECFDKVARILGLGYPGGPAIAAKASEFKADRGRASVSLPRPMIYKKDYDFSFSGLKTAVLYDFRSRSPKIRKSKEYIRAMCHEVQQAIIDVLIHKTLKAAKNFKVKSIILGGGVAANEELRKQFEEKVKKELPKTYYLKPEIYFCTDNAVMIAATAYFHQKEATRDLKKIKANANLKI